MIRSVQYGLLAVCMLAACAPALAAEPDVSALIKELAGEDFVVRERAQKELEKLPAPRLKELRQAEAATSDAEVKARLKNAIWMVEWEEVLNPPRLSVQVKDLPVWQACEEVNKQFGKRVVSTGIGTGFPPTERITLSMQDKSLWEILQEMDRQVPMRLGQWSTGVERPVTHPLPLGVFPADARGNQAWVIHGAFALRVRAVPWGKDKGAVQMSILTDPRVPVEGLNPQLVIEKMTDENGNAVTRIPLAQLRDEVPGGYEPHVMEEHEKVLSAGAVFFAMPEGMKAIRSFKGHVRVVVERPAKPGDMLEAEEKMNPNIVRLLARLERQTEVQVQWPLTARQREVLIPFDVSDLRLEPPAVPAAAPNK